MDIVFVAWSRLSRRTEDLVRILSVDLLFIPDGAPYFSAFVKTWRYLRKVKPSIVLVQLPQGPLLWEVLRLSKILKFSIVVDVHTGFVYYRSIKSYILNKPFNKLLKKANLVLAHNDPQRLFMIDKIGLDESKVITVYDPLPMKLEKIVRPKIVDLEPRGFLVLPASWADDEPIDFVVREFLGSQVSREYKLIITGDYGRNRKLYHRIVKTLNEKRDNVVITGYLPREEYYWLIENCKAVIALTNREYTMLSAIWEAITYNRPFIVSKTNTLKAIVDDYPCLFGLRKGDMQSVLEKCIYSPSLNVIEKTMEKLRKLSSTSIEELKKRLYVMQVEKRFID